MADIDNRHIVSLSARASQHLENDTAILTFAAQARANSPAKVIQQINQSMQEALEILEDWPQLLIQTGSYQVHPIYDNNRLTLWQGRQTLSLQTQDLAQLPELLQSLQTVLPYQSMQFTLSQTERQQIEKQLIPIAIQQLKTQAKLAMQSFSARQALPLTTHIQTQQSIPQMHALAKTLNNPAPSLKAGRTQITVKVQGKFVFLYQ